MPLCYCLIPPRPFVCFRFVGIQRSEFKLASIPSRVTLKQETYITNQSSYSKILCDHIYIYIYIYIYISIFISLLRQSQDLFVCFSLPSWNFHFCSVANFNVVPFLFCCKIYVFVCVREKERVFGG